MSTGSRNRVSALATLAATVGLLGLTAPASATIVTFTIEDGALTITSPTFNATVGQPSTSGRDQTVPVALGTAWVSDTRSPLHTGWIATVTCSDFAGENGTTSSETIATSTTGYTTVKGTAGTGTAMSSTCRPHNATIPVSTRTSTITHSVA